MLTDIAEPATPGIRSAGPPRAHLRVRGLELAAIARRGAPAERLVRGLDLTVRSGEAVALVGRSGSGKTLTGRAIGGCLPRTVRRVAGAIECADVTGRALRPHLIFQNGGTALDPFSTLGRNLERVMRRARRRGLEPSADDAAGCLERAGLRPADRFFERYAIELSGGEARRAALAVAHASGARIVIADEPTTGLDPALRVEIADSLMELARSGRGLLVITHEIGLFATRCDRLHVMHAGRIEATVTPDPVRWHGMPARGPARALFEAALAFDLPPIREEHPCVI